MIVSRDSHLDGEPTNELLLVLRCEDDYEHYAKRASAPGPTHPSTEAYYMARTIAAVG